MYIILSKTSFTFNYKIIACMLYVKYKHEHNVNSI